MANSLLPASNFRCFLQNDLLLYRFNIGEQPDVSSYIIEYAISNSLGVQDKVWMRLVSGDIIDELTSGSIFEDSLLTHNKFALFRVKLISDELACESDYVYCSLPKYFPYQSQLVDQNKTTPCITRTYKNNEWRQCRIQYYTLYPLVIEQQQSIVLDKYNRPLHVAKKET